MTQQPAPEAPLAGERAPVINDFTISVGTVNGSGSQTSNATLLRAMFKMGIPVAGKNLFPSNIQGLPTWYDIRVSKDSFLARKDERDIVVAMNPDTFAKDQADVVPDGAFFYDDKIRQPIIRTDISVYPMPVKKLVTDSGAPTNLRDYIANMVYVGVLTWVLLALTAAAQAWVHRYEINPDQELIALGTANISAGLFQGFTVDASLSSSATAVASEPARNTT